MKTPIIAYAAATFLLAGAAVFTTISASAQPQGRGDPRQMGDFLVNAIKASPGCLGVETAQTQSGKNVIFAWFEDKDAALAWYNSPVHQRMMGSFFPGSGEARQPLEHIPDDAGPILTIASLKFSDNPLPGTRMPVSDISIEMYTPLAGGIRVNEGFTPNTVVIPHMQSETIAVPQPDDGDDAAPATAEPARDR